MRGGADGGEAPEVSGTLLVVHLANAFGGAERTTLNILNGLTRQGFARVVVLAPEPMHVYWEPAADEVVDASPLGLAGWFVSPRRLRTDAQTLAQAIAAIRPDVILGMMHYMAVVAERAVRRLGTETRVVGSFRGPVFEHLRAYEPSRLRRLWIGWQLRRSGKRLFAITVPGPGTRTELLRHRVGTLERLQVIPNGIDPADFSERAQEELNLPDGVSAGRFVLALGRLSVEKNMGELLAGYLASGVDWPLVIVGDGPELDALRSQTWQSGAGARVHFVGSTRTPERWMWRAGVFVHACRYEGFGYTLLEALALGVPVIATDCPFGPREVLGEAGILVPPGDVGALAAAMARVVGSERLRGELKTLGRARAESFPLAASQQGHRRLLLAALNFGPSVNPMPAKGGGDNAH